MAHSRPLGDEAVAVAREVHVPRDRTTICWPSKKKEKTNNIVTSVFLRAFFFLFAGAGGECIKCSIEYRNLWGKRPFASRGARPRRMGMGLRNAWLAC